MPIVEAMACGVPVVASVAPVDGRGVRRRSRPRRSDDAEAIAAGIRDALERRDELVAAGLAHAAQFTWRRCGEIHLRAFEEAGVRVGLDVAPLLQTRAGTARWVGGLRRGLEARDDVERRAALAGAAPAG